MSLADEVRTVRQRVVARLSELEPLVHEYQELLELAGELGIVPAGEEAARTPAPRDSARSKPAGQRRRQSGTVAASQPPRDARLLDALRAKPGTTIADLASILGVPATSLYRPVRDLTSAGAVVKRGRGLYAAS